MMLNLACQILLLRNRFKAECPIIFLNSAESLVNTSKMNCNTFSDLAPSSENLFQETQT